MPGPTPILTHLALTVRDLTASISFYEQFCGMQVVHERGEAADRVVWMAEPGRERELIFVLLTGKGSGEQAEDDYSHLGFALASRAAVDEVALRAQSEGCLAWPARQEEFPVGYYCGVRAPSGHVIEFSYGQPLGPGSDPDEAASDQKR